jgi:hypothetical protein
LGAIIIVKVVVVEQSRSSCIKITFLDFDNDKDERNIVLQQYQQILNMLNVQEYGYQLQLGPIHMGVACTFNNK